MGGQNGDNHHVEVGLLQACTTWFYLILVVGIVIKGREVGWGFMVYD